jgi:nucleoside 2-deoxyribosyltransferase
MNNMKRVYIASPYTLGDTAVNVRKQIDAVDELMNYGFAPFAPLYSHFQHMIHPRPYEDWIAVDLVWVETCDCLLRLPGESSGADMEAAKAEELGIPVEYSIEELLSQEAVVPEDEKMEGEI